MCFHIPRAAKLVHAGIVCKRTATHIKRGALVGKKPGKIFVLHSAKKTTLVAIAVGF